MGGGGGGEGGETEFPISFGQNVASVLVVLNSAS